MSVNVLNVTVVVPNGKIIKTAARARKSSAEYDLTRLFIGSEGTLGIITEITVRLQRITDVTRVGLVHFNSIYDAASAAAATLNAGIQVRCVELIDEVAVLLINEYNGWAYTEKPTLMYKFSGSADVVELDIKRTQLAIQAYNPSTFVWSADDAESDRLWTARKQAGAAARTRWPEYSLGTTTDVCVPLGTLPTVLSASKDILLQSWLPTSIVSHAGDGNWHCGIHMRPDHPDDYTEANRIKSAIVELALQHDGTCTGEHGIGSGKKEYLLQEHGVDVVNIMKNIKRTIDPYNLFNPGKIFDLYPDYTPAVIDAVESVDLNEVLDLTPGVPPSNLLATDLIAAAYTSAIETDGGAALNYVQSQSLERTKSELAVYLSCTYHGCTGHQLYDTQNCTHNQFTPNNLHLTAGCSHAIVSAVSSLAKSGDVIFVESPTWFLVTAMFEKLGLQVHSIPIDTVHGGYNWVELEGDIQKYKPKLFYTIPVHNNPTAISFNKQTKQQLLQLAEQYNFTIVADEVYQLLDWSSQSETQYNSPSYTTISTTKYRDTPHPHVVSVSSFSKILAPGFRFGWIHGSADVIARISHDPVQALGSSFAATSIPAAYQLLSQRTIYQATQRLIYVYQQRATAITSAINTYFPVSSGVTHTPAQGGFFVWLQLPVNGRVTAEQLLTHVTEKYKVKAMNGIRCAVNTDTQPHVKYAIRLVFAQLSSSKLTEAVRRLAVAYNELTNITI